MIAETSAHVIRGLTEDLIPVRAVIAARIPLLIESRFRPPGATMPGMRFGTSGSTTIAIEHAGIAPGDAAPSSPTPSGMTTVVGTPKWMKTATSSSSVKAPGLSRPTTVERWSTPSPTRPTVTDARPTLSLVDVKGRREGLDFRASPVP